MSGVINKIKAEVDNVLHKNSSTHNDPTGPHSSHAANKADPRVDSDRIGTAGNTSGAGGIGGGQYTEGTTGHHTTGTTGMTGTHGHSDPTGPHDSRLANKMDPRVDSDQVGGAGNTSGAGGYGHSTTGGGLTSHSTTGTHGTTGSDPTGPHNTRIANVLDPRVDSDRVGGAGNTASAGGYGHGTTTGGGLTGHSTTGGYGTTGSDPTGPHDSRMANKMDPRVDSDRVGTAGNTSGAGGYGAGQYSEGRHTGSHGTTGGLGSSNPGSGNAPGTAGPHNSDLLNKMDPRVDSDMDGSKTYGGNQTYQ